MEMTIDKTQAPKWRKALLGGGAGAIMGFVGALTLATLSENGALGEIGASEEIAGIIGMVYVFTGLAVGVGVLSPAIGARFLNVEDAAELEEQRRLLAQTAIAMPALGIAMILLALAEPAGILPATIVFAGVVALLALTVWLGRAQRHQMDELMRNLSRETAATAFYLVALIGGGWAALAHLGFVGAPAPLDWVSLFAGLLLAATFISCFNRGLLRPR